MEFQIRSFLVLGLFVLLSSLAALADDGESIPRGEDEAIESVVAMIRKTVQDGYKQNGRASRDAHRKAHGCVNAEFQVQDGIAAELAQGLFASPQKYKTVIRFSNGSSEVKDDHDGDGRGFAIKILGVDGDRLEKDPGEELHTQDFLMINHPVFFVRNAADYVSFQKSVIDGSILWWLMNPFRVLHESRIALAIQQTKMLNPLESRYWSMTASKLGDRQMKFMVAPCSAVGALNPSDSRDRLAENLTAHLKSHSACFDFKVQLRTAKSMSVEDPSEEWSESESPYRAVARISIPPQVPDRGEACETLSFNPWNGLIEHRPLGGISRVRREVYREVSKLRHLLNGQDRKEP